MQRVEHPETEQNDRGGGSDGNSRAEEAVETLGPVHDQQAGEARKEERARHLQRLQRGKSDDSREIRQIQRRERYQQGSNAGDSYAKLDVEQRRDQHGHRGRGKCERQKLVPRIGKDDRHVDLRQCHDARDDEPEQKGPRRGPKHVGAEVRDVCSQDTGGGESQHGGSA